MAVSLLQLPPELIASIAKWLKKEDIRQLRQASSYLNDSTLDLFAARHFRKKGFMITTPSLKCLLNIAQHDRLRRHVQHLWFNPDCYEWHTPTFKAGSDFSGISTRQEALRIQQAFEACVTDHKDLLENCTALKYLEPIFASLENLRVLGMRRGAAYRPYGYSKLVAQFHIDPRVLGRPSYNSDNQDRWHGTSYLFALFISALGTSTAKLARLYTDAVQIDVGPRISLPFGAASHALVNLQCLELNLVFSRMPYVSKSDRRRYANDLITFLQTLPNLSDVCVSVIASTYRGFRRRLLQRPDLEGYHNLVFMERVVSEAPLYNLRRVKIDKLRTTTRLLKAFLMASASKLQSLKLRDVDLLSTAGSDASWPTIWAFLADACGQLEYLVMVHIRADEDSVDFSPHAKQLIYNPPDNDPPGARRTPLLFEVTGREEIQKILPRLIQEFRTDNAYVTEFGQDTLWYTDTSEEEK